MTEVGWYGSPILADEYEVSLCGSSREKGVSLEAQWLIFNSVHIVGRPPQAFLLCCKGRLRRNALFRLFLVDDLDVL